MDGWIVKKNLRRGLFLLLIYPLLLSFSGCSRPQSNDTKYFFDSGSFNATNAMAETKGLVAIMPRHSGSPGARKAAEHLFAGLRAMGVEASLDEFEEETPAGKIIFRNVIGILPGKNNDSHPAATWIIIGAHYDTKSGIADDFEGANDSGSGAGILLELARVIKNSLRVPAAPAALCGFSRHSPAVCASLNYRAKHHRLSALSGSASGGNFMLTSDYCLQTSSSERFPDRPQINIEIILLQAE